MAKKRMPKSLRKFIRFEKARIRRQFFDSKEREKLISELYQRFNSGPKEKNLSVAKPAAKTVKADSKIKTK